MCIHLLGQRPAVSYDGTILAAPGVSSAAATTIASWPANNVSDRAKRATAQAIQLWYGFRNSSFKQQTEFIRQPWVTWWEILSSQASYRRERGDRLRDSDEGIFFGGDDPHWRFQTWRMSVPSCATMLCYLSAPGPQLGIRLLLLGQVCFLVVWYRESETFQPRLFRISRDSLLHHSWLLCALGPIIHELGYSAAQTQLLSISPYAAGFPLTIIITAFPERTTPGRGSHVGPVVAASGVYSAAPVFFFEAAPIAVGWLAINLDKWGDCERNALNLVSEISGQSLGQPIVTLNTYARPSATRSEISPLRARYGIFSKRKRVQGLRGGNEGAFFGDDDPRQRFQT